VDTTENNDKKAKKVLFKGAFNPYFALFCLIILLAGVQRFSFTFLQRYLLEKEKNIKGLQAAAMQMCRIVLEILFYSALKKFFKKKKHYEMIFCSAIFLCAVKPILFKLGLKTQNKIVSNIILYSTDISKGFFTCLFGISHPLICHDIASKGYKSFSMGIYNGLYNGGSTVVFSIF